MVNIMSGIYRYCRYETAEKTSFYDTVVVLFPWKLEKQKDLLMPVIHIKMVHLEKI